ncbi:RNA polymerase sigma-70 factor (ECF subfamily) [Pontibacter ummariensis]|uniref:RNA polymerase sigma-70 factor, ECF subfamily n=1 Tax=Pontibacter ummariensis TaxID=1610492 RepID=A0A239B806_9BACT|nr:RNA polymerase sigma-70 factor [Pontibacter ummariensis]PRY16365.1 RNA polymerase sigma-70 factor (ECF subfamily) [Pontibacter ummariensis]SNS03899.1 RNA polymerase sigma-70 factor, ECF subfamily [Pontibacter ummariensis]
MKPPPPVSLASSIAALKADDMSAFENLYQAFEPKLFTFALRLVRQREEAEEIVQEVFLKVWDHRHQLNPEQNFDGYLFRIAKNIVYNKARHKAYEFAFAQYMTAAGVNAGCFTEEKVAYEDLARLLEEASDALPPVRRQVFVMSRVEGKSNSEIAQLLNTSNSNIENHLNKALKAIKEKLKTYEIAYAILLFSSLS